MEFIIGKYNYWIYVMLMMIGFYAMIVKNNLAKKVVGMNIFQTSIILFFISTGVKKGATVPIVIGDAHGHAIPGTLHAIDYVSNPDAKEALRPVREPLFPLHVAGQESDPLALNLRASPHCLLLFSQPES